MIDASDSGSVLIPVSVIEFHEGGRTIWVHGPDGGTVLRLKLVSGAVTSEQCLSSSISHADAIVHGDVRFCLAADVTGNQEAP